MFNIAVIGGGVVGLPTALFIQKKLGSKGKVTIFSDKLSPHTTGDIAAGLWTPYLLEETSEEKIIQWAKATQNYILDLWKKGAAKEAGICLQAVLAFSEEKDFRLRKWLEITLGYSVIPSKEISKYNKKFAKQYAGGVSYVTFTWEAAKFLPYLQEEFLKNGGEMRQQEIRDFKQLARFDVIVNCTGLGSRSLVPDLAVRPIRGQIIRVDAPWQYHCWMEDEHYIIPNQDCVILGGTHQENDFNINVDENDNKFILQGTAQLVPSLLNAPVIKNQAGLRPGRYKVRLEIENRTMDDRILKIVHNYGHGGSGVTLSVGCAEEATQLVMALLGLTNNSKL